jgi:hypothetical protein
MKFKRLNETEKTQIEEKEESVDENPEMLNEAYDIERPNNYQDTKHHL